MIKSVHRNNVSTVEIALGVHIVHDTVVCFCQGLDGVVEHLLAPLPVLDERIFSVCVDKAQARRNATVLKHNVVQGD